MPHREALKANAARQLLARHWGSLAALLESSWTSAPTDRTAPGGDPTAPMKWVGLVRASEVSMLPARASPPQYLGGAQDSKSENVWVEAHLPEAQSKRRTPALGTPEAWQPFRERMPYWPLLVKGKQSQSVVLQKQRH